MGTVKLRDIKGPQPPSYDWWPWDLNPDSKMCAYYMPGDKYMSGNSKPTAPSPEPELPQKETRGCRRETLLKSNTSARFWWPPQTPDFSHIVRGSRELRPNQCIASFMHYRSFVKQKQSFSQKLQVSFRFRHALSY